MNQPPPVASFVLDEFEPAYLGAYRQGRLDAKVAAARRELAECRACPRDCGVNRLDGDRGVCKTGRHAIVSNAFPHFGEEDCLRGTRGSGTIFFGFCNLRCVFCQNWDISQRESGRPCTSEEIANLMLELQDLGCHNINLVTPEHVAPQVVEALAVAIPQGLCLPLVYNTSAYDGLASLELMDGLVDVYMPDFKFWSPELARRYARARDYPAVARTAIEEMHRQVGPLRFDRDGIALRGVLVRHLVMPGRCDEAAAIFKWLAQEISPDTYVNIMGQYRPEHRVGAPDAQGRSRYEEINRRPSPAEMEAACETARDAGLWRFDRRLGPGRAAPIRQ